MLHENVNQRRATAHRRPFKARKVIWFSSSYIYTTLECNVLASLVQLHSPYQNIWVRFGPVATEETEGKKNGSLSRTASYTLLINMLVCLNYLLEDWLEIEQYPQTLESSPKASHLFLCRVRTEPWRWATTIRKHSPGETGSWHIGTNQLISAQ